MGLEPVGAILIVLIFPGAFVVCWYPYLRGLLLRITSLHISTVHNWSLAGAFASLYLMLRSAPFMGDPFISNLKMVCATAVIAVVFMLVRRTRSTEEHQLGKGAALRFLTFASVLLITSVYLIQYLFVHLIVDD